MINRCFFYFKQYLSEVESSFVQRFWFTDDPITLRLLQFVFEPNQGSSNIEIEVYGCYQCKYFNQANVYFGFSELELYRVLVHG